MKKLFITDEGFDKEFSRNRAKGHKRLIITDAVKIAEPMEIRTEGTDLVIDKAEDSDEPEIYTMLCKEFGLVGKTIGFRSKISVIFLDNGWMLVTLLHGALVMNLENRLLMPTVGDDVNPPKVVTEDICWVNAENLLEYSKYLGVKGNFMYDMEFVFEVGGDNLNGLRSFSLKPKSDEDTDISLGYLAMYEQQLKLKEEAKEARMLAKTLINKTSNSSFDFDEEDVEEDEDEDDDWDDYDL